MHRDVDPSREQRVLDFLCEEPFALELVERAIDFGVAARLDDHYFGCHAERGEPPAHPLRLPLREPAAPGAELHANLRTSASTNAGTVCGSASSRSARPCSRAVPAVTGPITAAANRPDVAALRPTRSTKWRTVDDDVNVTASIRPSRSSTASQLRSMDAGTVR